MIVLHGVLLKMLQIFFDNFLSDFRGQEVASTLQRRDVEENSEVFQFNVAALYQLQSAWKNKYVHMSAAPDGPGDMCRHTHTCMQQQTDPTPDKNTGFIAFPHRCICSYECFSISCELTYGVTKICNTGVSENISTALTYENKIHCNRK